MNYLSAENISKSFGEQLLFEGLTFGLARGDKTALIARNGTGKTTLLRILTGKESPDTGDFTFRNGIKTAFLEQEPDLDNTLTIEELILTANTPILSVIQHYEKVLRDHAEQQTVEARISLEEATNEMDRVQAWDYDRRLKQLLDLFRITDTSQNVSSLSGGEKKRLALALVLLDEPEMLILDEPTNHLDIDMIEWLERYLAQSNLTLLMVTHDRYFLDRVCNRIIELSLGNLYHYHGNYGYFLQKRTEREENRKVEADRATQLMKKELEWLRRMPKARTGKSKARIDAFEGIKDKANLASDSSELKLQVKAPRLGGKILELERINKKYGSLNLISDFSYKFTKGERVGIIGRNGTGKTTFLNVISGLEVQDSGGVDTGETVVMGYYRQMGQEWQKDQRVIDAVKEIAEVVVMEGGRTISASQFLEHFMFSPDSQYKKISKLSGGELRRLHLLTVLIKNPNFLILDEPTNDLDLFALNKLEEFLLSFKGCLLIVSHDRYFLDKLTDHLFIFKGDGMIKDHYGSYSVYRQQLESVKKQARKTIEPVTGHRNDSREKGAAEKTKTKLTYKEQQEYTRLEPEIEDLEEEKASLEEELNAGTLDYESLNRKSLRVAELIELIDTRIQRWMELGQYL
ncbi:MAG: ABC-F family ATP-binding cassette domain-containing protein [Bacteroidales bacterium]|nr:ABC-F family ATP-binding cassette domain-containing protein [Bacteroidales bacterium]